MAQGLWFVFMYGMPDQDQPVILATRSTESQLIGPIKSPIFIFPTEVLSSFNTDSQFTSHLRTVF